MSNTFSCDVCKKTFERMDGWTDKDAMEEYKSSEVYMEGHPIGRVCDDCYNLVNSWVKTLTVDQIKKMEKEYKEKFHA